MNVLKLIKAEFIKIFSRKSTWIATIIAILIVIFMFSASKIFEKFEKTTKNDYYTQIATWQMESLDETIKSYIIKSDNQSKLILDMSQYKKSYLNEIKDMDIINNRWKESLNTEYQNLKDNALLVELIKKGHSISEIQKANENILEPLSINEEIFNYEFMSEKELNEYYAKLNKQIEEIRNFLIGDKTYFEFLAREIKQIKTNIIENNNQIESNKKQINNLKDKKTIEILEGENRELALLNERFYNIVQWKQYMIDNKIDEKNYKYEIILSVIDYYSSNYKQDSLMKEEDYYKSEQFKQNTKLDYNKYLKIAKTENKETENNFLKNVYAIENNIDIFDGSKCKLDNNLEGICIIASILVIIVAGGIVAKEFSTGTIRMLVIRPVKRWKILLAKLITVLLYMLFVIIILTVVAILTLGICYGFNDLFKPGLSVVDNNVVEIQFGLSVLKSYLVLLIPIVFFVMFAFAISTVMRSSVMAIALSIAALLGGQIIQSLFYYTFPKVWISYTPIPYISMSYFLKDITVIEKLNITYGMNISILNGVLIYSLLLAIIIPISFITFNKIDIKNQ